IATVVNFPSGEEPVADMITMTETAVAEGADEIDMVIPYRPFLEGEEEDVHSRVARVKAAAGPARVKAILETGILEDPERIRRAAEIAIEGGADFIKTSTGKVAVNATLEAARMMLEVIRDHGPGVGLKPAGGVKTTVQAAAYLDLADEIMGEGWASPATFRFGASGLLDALLATIEGREAAAAEGY
ncbi:MAG: deoxyribose-phosphate aldolase, partial [Pseudomonadota bacterium]